MRLLVTGFGPFPRMPRNPSGRLALAVAASPRWRIADVAARGVVLTTSYAALTGELAPELAAGTDAVLLIGVAGRSRMVRVETRGTSRRSRLFPDAAGHVASTTAATVRRTRIAAVKPLRIIRSHALPSRISRDAGRYLCNAAYHQALADAAPALFIHIPMPPRAAKRRAAASRPSRSSYDERLTSALVEMGLLLLREARSRPAQASRMASCSTASTSQPT